MIVMITHRINSLALHVGWPRAAAVALMLLALTLVWHARERQPIIAAPPAAQLPQFNGLPKPKGTSVEKEHRADYSQLCQFENIVRTSSPDGEHLLLLTFSWRSEEQGIKCVDPGTGSVKWHRDPVGEGRYTYVKANETTLVECSGFPQQNWLAVRRLSDGAVLGCPFEVGRLYDYAISGRRVATIEPVVLLHGREIPVTSMGETSDGPWATRVRVYDEWGHVLRSIRVDDSDAIDGGRRTRLFACPDGFVVVSKAGRVAFLIRNGHGAARFH
jgi:hypothetical protein